ncbi:MAG: hypothetical protein U9N36_10000 [Euryarchaeota archaeon]|nr:hypothetical protein [Euryarchaeota archaeon]
MRQDVFDIGQDDETTETASDVTIPSENIAIRDEIGLVDIVIAKHKQFLETYKNEFVDIDSHVSKLRESSSEEKRERDDINESVAELKEKRQLLYRQIKQSRIEMFDLININRDVRKNEQEMAQLQKEIEALDWRLQTTVMGIQKEREIVEKIKKLSAQIEEVDDVEPSDETGKQIEELATGIKKMTEDADGCHNELVGIADKSQEHHGSFVEYAEQLKGTRGRHIWLQSRIKSHESAVSYWEGKQGELQAEIAAGGDDDD